MPGRRGIYLAGAGLTGLGIAAWRTLFPWIGDDFRTIIALKKVYEQIMKAIENDYFIIDMFEEHVRRTPKKAFMIFEDKIYTYEIMNDMANKVANLAMGWNLAFGETVAVLIENEPAFVWTFLGLQKIGISVALINFHITGKPLTHSIRTSGAKVIIIGQNPTFLDSFMEIRDTIPLNIPVYVQGKRQCDLPEGYRSMSDELVTTLPVHVNRTVRKDMKGTSTLCYIFTSGTTGLPKPAILNQTKGGAISQMFQLFDYNSEDTVYIVTPMYHSSALNLGFFNTISTGATFVLRRKFSARHFWEDVRKYNVTVVQYIGELCRYLLAVPKHADDGKHKVRCAIGNGLRQDIWTEFQTRFNIPQIYEFFGATEGTSSFINVVNKTGAIGRLSPFLRKLAGNKIDMLMVRFDKETSEPIRGSNGLCIETKPGELGLLMSLIPPSHSGFYKGPKEMDDKKTVKDVLQKGDQWFNFGDVVYLDHDYFIYFRDRMGDTFRWKSENVSTGEVSNVIGELTFIHDVNVYGVEVPGADGKAGMAAIILKENCHLTDDVLKKLYRQVEQGLPSYARPLFIRFMKEFIITQTLKNRKVEMVKEGFDPTNVTDPLYVIDSANKTYKVLTSHNYQQVLHSKL